jgi:hypothetical protein
MNSEITDEDIKIHLAQIKWIKENSTSKKVIDDACDTEKVIKDFQKVRYLNNN